MSLHLRILSRGLSILLLLALSGLGARAGHAMVPSTVAVQGVLTTANGALAPDGNYAIWLQIYGGEQAVQPVWKEGPLTVQVQSGRFAVQLGSQTPLTSQALGSLPQAWLGVTVGTDPELPRKQLQSSPFALRAAIAEGVDCSGCIGAGQMDPNFLSGLVKTTDLAGYAQSAALSKIAASGSYKDLADTPKLADVATTGQYNDLFGLPTLAKVGTTCGTGLVVAGIAADGSLQCVASSMAAKDLPPDGLNEVSNGLLTNQFGELAVSSNTPIAIADGLGAGVSDVINVPDYGTCEGLTVEVGVSNSDVAKVRVDLYDPNGGKYTIYNGEKTGKTLTVKVDAPGGKTLDAWVGQNPKGLWSIVVADISNNNLGKDGNIEAFKITVKTLSTKKVAATGLLIAQGGFKYQLATSHPVTCDAAQTGYTYLNTQDKAVYVCNGKDWFPIIIQALGTQDNPGASCKDILTKVPLSKNAFYWIDPDGLGGNTPFQAWCDMTTDGGGWTRAVLKIGGDTTTCNTANLWANMLKITKGWPQGGLVMSKYYSGAQTAADGGAAVSVVKFSPGPYGSIYAMFSFPKGSDGWTHSGSGAFNLQVISGTGYGNAVWWDWGGALDRKANFCIGTAPDHQACLYEGTYHNNCGKLYHDGAWAAGASLELYVRE